MAAYAQARVGVNAKSGFAFTTQKCGTRLSDGSSSPHAQSGSPLLSPPETNRPR